MDETKKEEDVEKEFLLEASSAQMDEQEQEKLLYELLRMEKEEHSACAFSREQHTFSTYLIPLTWNDIDAMSRAHNHKYGTQHHPLTVSEVNVLHDLEVRLDDAIRKQGGRAFVKVGAQSAKDVALFVDNQRTKKVLRKRLKNTNISDPNELLIAFLESLNLALCVKTGSQALQLLISSHRIYRELENLKTSSIVDSIAPEIIDDEEEAYLASIRSSRLHTDRSEEEHSFEEDAKQAIQLRRSRERLMEQGMYGISSAPMVHAITVREFKRMRDAAEFRGFVRNKELVAISQYESGAYYSSLQEDSGESIKISIVSFFEHIKSRFMDNDFIIDFAIIENQVYIVEISEWDESSSACLFDWQEDSEELTTLPLSFRIRDEPLPDPLQAVPSRRWRQYISDCIMEMESARSRQLRSWTMAGAAALLGTVAVWYLKSK